MLGFGWSGVRYKTACENVQLRCHCFVQIRGAFSRSPVSACSFFFFFMNMIDHVQNTVPAYVLELGTQAVCGEKSNRPGTYLGVRQKTLRSRLLAAQKRKHSSAPTELLPVPAKRIDGGKTQT